MQQYLVIVALWAIYTYLEVFSKYKYHYNINRRIYFMRIHKIGSDYVFVLLLHNFMTNTGLVMRRLSVFHVAVIAVNYPVATTIFVQPNVLDLVAY